MQRKTRVFDSAELQTFLPDLTEQQARKYLKDHLCPHCDSNDIGRYVYGLIIESTLSEKHRCFNGAAWTTAAGEPYLTPDCYCNKCGADFAYRTHE